MKPQRCPDCVFRYDRPDLWENCLDCAEDDDTEVEVPGSEEEDVVLAADDEVVDALSYGFEFLEFEGEVYD